MAKFLPLAAAAALALCVGIAGWALKPSAAAQDSHAPQEPKPNRKSQRDLFTEQHKDSVLSWMGTMSLLIPDAKGGWRDAVLYKDGSVRLWISLTREPAAPPLRHKTPIREFRFLEKARLLLTTSDDSVKVWDALSGTLKKEMDGQFARPLFFVQGPDIRPPCETPRFVTVDLGGRVATTWDVATLEPVDKFEPEGPKLIGAGLSCDGKSMVTFGEDRSVTLWQLPEHRRYATLCPPSSLIERVFVGQGIEAWKQPVLQLDRRFWDSVKPLGPPDKAK